MDESGCADGSHAFVYQNIFCWAQLIITSPYANCHRNLIGNKKMGVEFQHHRRGQRSYNYIMSNLSGLPSTKSEGELNAPEVLYD